MRHAKTILALAAAAALCFSLVGFIGTEASYAATNKVHLNKTSISLEVGKTYQQKLLNKNGKTIKATKVTWTSKKKTVAKISKKGKVTAVKAGTAKMTAKYSGKTYKFTVKVTKPVYKLASSSVTVAIGKTYQQKLLKNGKAVSATSVVWKSSDSDVAMITSDGKVTGRKAGTTKMTAKYNSTTYSFTVTVPKISFVKTSTSLMQYETQRMTLLVDKSITNVSWEIGNTDMVSASWPDNSWGTYDESTNTVVLDIKGWQAGSTTVTVYDTYDSTVKTVLDVTVTPCINSWISVEALSLGVGESKTITINTSNGGGISWDYNTNIISCERGEWINDYDYTLKITGVSAGQSLLKISDSNDPSVYTFITVTVTS